MTFCNSSTKYTIRSTFSNFRNLVRYLQGTRAKDLILKETEITYRSSYSFFNGKDEGSSGNINLRWFGESSQLDIKYTDDKWGKLRLLVNSSDNCEMYFKEPQGGKWLLIATCTPCTSKQAVKFKDDIIFTDEYHVRCLGNLVSSLLKGPKSNDFVKQILNTNE